MYTSACGYHVDCSEFISGIYTDIVDLYLHIKIGISSRYMVFEGHICCQHKYGNRMVSKSCKLLFFLLICAVMWGIFRLQ